MADPEKRLTDEEYKFIYERVPRLCLDFIIVKDDKVLLSKRDIAPYKGYWHLPGGMVRYKESFDEAAERILKSELGLKPKMKKLIGYMQMPDEINENNTLVHSVSIAFLTTLEEGDIKGSEQAHEIEYFALLPEENLHPIQGKFLKEYWGRLMEM
ncbi:MAG: hypothetical protein A2908_01700 [Candidatus Staskawiczbacteria bacterium RIFCSPLOWO2_01_FULL_38_12b]|uniref:Nudix hydrolase domain-containing protein n=1 Tax=Candidatus Staskawiczbacteria bacterium RIFCSPLOWO2_01_FULL_38_12b TaxID=1802214 RepID=A0A1G2ID91_9BACT|nr:MAG: hypothetical protein A2908_01700 [Candidatus Staskawiczbacteria bacterium RIFCSPLOWO2_01_FULL_38_12b]